METTTTPQTVSNTNLREEIMDVFRNSQKTNLTFADVRSHVPHSTDGAIRQALVRMAKHPKGGIVKAKRGQYRLSPDERVNRVEAVMKAYGAPLARAEISHLIPSMSPHAIDLAIATLANRGLVVTSGIAKSKRYEYVSNDTQVEVTPEPEEVIEEPTVAGDTFTIDTTDTLILHIVSDVEGGRILAKSDDGKFYLIKETKFI